MSTTIQQKGMLCMVFVSDVTVSYPLLSGYLNLLRGEVTPPLCDTLFEVNNEYDFSSDT